ncbi:MAG: O-antigen ligase family protein [Methylococcaceae bacterium]|nr:O-antigen ligase family protein [Methylococcaceae bacterium]
MQTLVFHNLSDRIQARAPVYGACFISLFLIAIYFSTALAIILSGVIGLFWLLTGQFFTLARILKEYPIAAWSLLLFICFFVGSAYGNASIKETFVIISKYRELFFIPVLIPFLKKNPHRNWVWLAFTVASVLSFSISYLMSLGILDMTEIHGPSWKSRITHSLFMAFFAFYCMHKAYNDNRFSTLYVVMFLLSAYNLFFIVEGRSGQLIAVALVALFALQRFKIKGRILTILGFAVFMGLFLNFSDKSSRIHEGIANTKAYMKEHPEQTDSSMGQRYTFWHYSLKLMAEKPFIGHGTGSFAQEYQRVAKGEHFMAQHPHNEFLLIGVQLGIMGLIPYFGFLVSLFYYSLKLPDQDKWLAQGLLVSLVIISLVNTPIFDHTEGHWFACMIALCFASLGSDDKILKEDI